MKPLKLFMAVISLLSIITLTACGLDDDIEKVPTDKVEQVFLLVSSEPGTYYLLSPSEGPYAGMRIKETNDKDWTCVSFDAIKGFTYEEGYEYGLVVRKITLANPPQDGSNIRYELVSIVSKTVPEKQ